jgi:leucyl aminopeptidase
MNIEIVSASALEYSTPALVIGCCQDDKDDLFSSLDKALDGLLERLYSSREFTGKAGATRLIHTFGKVAAERLLLVGLGKKGELDAERLRQAAGNAVQALKRAKVASFASVLHISSVESAIESTCEGALLGSYSFDLYKTREKEESFRFELMTMLVNYSSPPDAAERVERTVNICQGVALTRDLVSQPGNVATTGYLAATAHELAGRRGLTCLVLEVDYLEKLAMNALLAVGKGSVEPPRLIVLEYHGAQERERPTVLVGKGITFDTGGISLKPREGMEAMKTDMAGAAAVMGTLEAVAALKLPINVVGLIPTAENMPGSRAYKPGDVITAMSGTTIEITNTDAEGRLVLCDALHYASIHYRPAAIIDLATLTGACVVALGHEASGLMGNDRRLLDELKRAAEKSGERLWDLPLWDEYGETMKSDIADLRNSGGRYAGAILAGWFLKQFVGNRRWAHLDIAGTAWADKSRAYTPKGATGVGVRLLVEYLQRGVARKND